MSEEGIVVLRPRRFVLRWRLHLKVGFIKQSILIYINCVPKHRIVCILTWCVLHGMRRQDHVGSGLVP